MVSFFVYSLSLHDSLIQVMTRGRGWGSEFGTSNGSPFGILSFTHIKGWTIFRILWRQVFQWKVRVKEVEILFQLLPWRVCSNNIYVFNLLRTFCVWFLGPHSIDELFTVDNDTTITVTLGSPRLLLLLLPLLLLSYSHRRTNLSRLWNR